MSDEEIADPDPATDEERDEAMALLEQAGDLVSDVEYGSMSAIIQNGTGAQIRALIKELKRRIAEAQPGWRWVWPRSGLDDGPP